MHVAKRRKARSGADLGYKTLSAFNQSLSLYLSLSVIDGCSNTPEELIILCLQSHKHFLTDSLRLNRLTERGPKLWAIKGKTAPGHTQWQHSSN